MRNDRLESEPASGSWVEVEPDHAEGGPWRRCAGLPLVPDETGRRLFLVGGTGGLSGVQTEQMPGVRGFDGRFHYLDDIWELDLQKNTWRRLLPLGCFDPVRLRVAAYFSKIRGLVILEGMKTGDDVSLARASLLRDPAD